MRVELLGCALDLDAEVGETDLRDLLDFLKSRIDDIKEESGIVNREHLLILALLNVGADLLDRVGRCKDCKAFVKVKCKKVCDLL